MPIDMHSHWFPASLVAALRARTIAPTVARRGDGADVLQITRGRIKLDDDHVALARRLAIMDRHGITTATLSIPGAGIDNLDAAEALPLAQLFNDGLAAACRDHPGRFAGFLTLPCQDMDLAVAEFERLMGQPGVLGALLPGNDFFSYEAAVRYRPLLAVAERHRALLFVHPSPLPEGRSQVPSEDIDNATQRRAALDNQSQISRFMVTLCLTDLLDPFPNVAIQVPNIGGNIPLEVERMDHISLNRTPGAEPPSSRLRRCYVDCNSFGPRGIELAAAVYGADKVVLGTDGTDFGTEWSLHALAQARLDDAARRAIAGGNANALIAARLPLAA